MASHTGHHAPEPKLRDQAQNHDASFGFDDEPLDPQGHGAIVRGVLAQFRNDRPDMWAGLGMDDEAVTQVRYNPIENYVELPICRADASKESVRAFIIYFWAHSSDDDMKRIYFYYAR